MKFFTKYSPPPSPGLVCDDKSLTRQDCAKECDINYIVSRAGAGLAQPLTCPEPVYQDLSEVPDNLQDALNIQIDAQRRFDAMPSRVRERFANDPARLIAFLRDKANRDEAVKLGLIPEPPKPVSAPAEEVKQ